MQIEIHSAQLHSTIVIHKILHEQLKCLIILHEELQ